MLRQTTLSLRSGLKSHQIGAVGSPQHRNRYATTYGSQRIKYGDGGFGISVYSARKSRHLRIRPYDILEKRTLTPKDPLSTTSTVLSAHWRAFALEDGGVLFTHPSHKQLMTWGQEVLNREAEVMTENMIQNAKEKGLPPPRKTAVSAMNHHISSKIQGIIADKTLENAGIAEWRKKHLWHLMRAKTQPQDRSRLRDTAHSSIFYAVKAAYMRRVD
eukprot:Tbor_TRINITY_DN5725_c1_g2::TRINITY_DN5725_c1_g2_i1::g.19605::m.19605